MSSLTARLNKRLYNLRKSRGECPKCGKKNRSRYVCCNRCRLIIKVRMEKYREKGDSRIKVVVKDGPRCRCGLLLPCDNCLPSIVQVASCGPWDGKP